MADGTLKVGTITNSAGSGNITIGSGVTLLSNVPAFQVVPTAEQSISANSYTKLTFGTENWDIGSCFDLTNSKFVVPTGKAGKYDFYGRYLIRSNDDKEYYISFYKNGAIVTNTEAKEVTGGGAGAAGAQTVATLDLSVGDEIECYVYHSSNGAKNTYVNYTVFSGYRIGA